TRKPLSPPGHLLRWHPLRGVFQRHLKASQLRDGRLLLLLQRSEPLSEFFLFGLVGILELFHPAFRLGELSLGRLIRFDQRMVVRQSIRHTWCRIRSRLRFGSRLLDSWLISHDQISPVSGT